MLAGIITDYAFGLGYMLLAGVAYLIRDWRKLQLAISAPGFLLIFYIWWEVQPENWIYACSCYTMNALCVALSSSSPLISAVSSIRVLPQSARWLLANDRREEAIALLRKAALVNGRVLPPAVQVCVCFIRPSICPFMCQSAGSINQANRLTIHQVIHLHIQPTSLSFHPGR